MEDVFSTLQQIICQGILLCNIGLKQTSLPSPGMSLKAFSRRRERVLVALRTVPPHCTALLDHEFATQLQVAIQIRLNSRLSPTGKSADVYHVSG